ncbi:MAG TPA: hypothetical protein VJW23_00810 [Propionibacteriaceae bacterium]|nr:hypothetical protein [Propionibacteriaceae bacterium]
MRKILIGLAGLVLAASLATSVQGQEPKLVTCNTGLTFLADIYTDRVLMGEGYIVTTGADGRQYLVAVPGSAVRAKPIRCSLAE